MGRRNRDDDIPGLSLAAIGGDRDARVVPLDATHRCLQHHSGAQFGCHGFGDLLGAAREMVLLGPVFDVEHPVHATGGVYVARSVQHRYVVGFAPPGHPGHDGHQVTR